MPSKVDRMDRRYLGPSWRRHSGRGSAGSGEQDRLTERQALIKRHGAVIVTPSGHLRPNPALKVEVDARNGMLAALRMLNLDIEPLRDGPGRPAGTFRPDRGKRYAQ